MNAILELLNIITSNTIRKSSSLKKRVFGNYEYLTKAKYHRFVTISCITDFILVFLMYLSLRHLSYICYVSKMFDNVIPIFSSQLNTYLIILVLSLAIIFVTLIIYNLLFYPRAYRKYEQPKCSYYDNGSCKKGFIVNILKNKALVKDSMNYKNECLRLIDLSKIRYIYKTYSYPSIVEKLSSKDMSFRHKIDKIVNYKIQQQKSRNVLRSYIDIFTFIIGILLFTLCIYKLHISIIQPWALGYTFIILNYGCKFRLILSIILFIYPVFDFIAMLKTYGVCKLSEVKIDSNKIIKIIANLFSIIVKVFLASLIALGIIYMTKIMLVLLLIIILIAIIALIIYFIYHKDNSHKFDIKIWMQNQINNF